MKMKLLGDLHFDEVNTSLRPSQCFVIHAMFSYRILKVLCRDLRLDLDFDFERLAHGTPGYVGADLMSLAREAAITAVSRSVRRSCSFIIIIIKYVFVAAYSQHASSRCTSDVSRITIKSICHRRHQLHFSHT